MFDHLGYFQLEAQTDVVNCLSILFWRTSSCDVTSSDRGKYPTIRTTHSAHSSQVCPPPRAGDTRS